MQQRELTHDVQTLESTELGRLLRRNCLPREGRSGEIIRTPDHLLPSRWQIIDYIVAKYGHCPPADIGIVYGSAFFSVRVPTTGKLYINCFFQDCDLEPATGHWELLDSVIDGGNTWNHAFRSGGVTAKGNVVKV